MRKENRGLLDEDQTRELLIRAKAGDYQSRERLAAGHQRLIGSIVRRFLVSGRERDDLYQVGCIGLLKAIDRFDPQRGVCFSTYAVPLIMGEIRRYLRDDAPLSVSRGLKELAQLLERKRRELRCQWGAEPELWQLAEACQCSPQEALAALEAARPPLSINQPRETEQGESGGLSQLLAAKPPGGADALEDGLDLRAGLEDLPQRLRWIVEQRYFGELTQSQIAQILGLSQAQVSRLERQALAQLRRSLGA